MPISKEELLEIIADKTDFLFLPWDNELQMSGNLIKLNTNSVRDKIDAAKSFWYSKDVWFDQVYLYAEEYMTEDTLLGNLLTHSS